MLTCIFVNDVKQIFDNELKNYVSLEQNLYEFMAMYKDNPNNQLKYMLEKIILYCKNQLMLLMDFSSKFLSGDYKKYCDEQFNIKFEDLLVMEQEISGMKK